MESGKCENLYYNPRRTILKKRGERVAIPSDGDERFCLDGMK
jgi:hypothetical protein